MLGSRVRETALLTGVRGAEASLIAHGDRWWMFYTIVGPGAQDQRELHLAFADRLTGPWTPHPLNPVLDDRAGARPGGTPFVDPTDGALVLPVQDCSVSYGGALRFLKFTRLDEAAVQFEHLATRLTGELADGRDDHERHPEEADEAEADVDVLPRLVPAHRVSPSLHLRSGPRRSCAGRSAPG